MLCSRKIDANFDPGHAYFRYRSPFTCSMKSTTLALGDEATRSTPRLLYTMSKLNTRRSRSNVMRWWLMRPWRFTFEMTNGCVAVLVLTRIRYVPLGWPANICSASCAPMSPWNTCLRTAFACLLERGFGRYAASDSTRCMRASTPSRLSIGPNHERNWPNFAIVTVRCVSECEWRRAARRASSSSRQRTARSSSGSTSK
mmetsp:Transcript_12425/g.30510  ORF Transcript_12425/g.30510 Transcript_12425/m.30510 type:complete len:200 (-) Transcript_12425:111-710(-)